MRIIYKHNVIFVELQNRKILEELQLKKQMLLKQGVAPTLNTSLAVTSTGSASTVVINHSFIIIHTFFHL